MGLTKWIGQPLLYLLIAAGGALSFLLIQWKGHGLSAPPLQAAPALPGGAPQFNVLLHVLLALVVIIVVTRALGTAFRLFHQPLVIGEIVGGILLGPTLLGHLPPRVFAYLMPGSVVSLLDIIAQLGVMLFMFLVGLGLDLTALRRNGSITLTVSYSSIVAPFVLGAALTLLLYERYAASNVTFVTFSLFLGISLSITAFPVLARILTERGISETPVGRMSLACASVNDVTAWCLLALVVSVLQAKPADAVLTVVLTLVFISAMLVFVRPLAEWSVAKLERRGLTDRTMAVVLVGIMLSALATSTSASTPSSARSSSAW